VTNAARTYSGYETLAVTRRGPIGWLAFDRPEVGNAMDATMLAELERAWLELDADPEVRVIVNTGNGPAFQTGLDVVQLSRDKEALREQSRRTRDATLKLTAWHNQVWKPVIAAVNGTCAGGGLHFVADADIVIAAESATFLDPHVSVGQVSAFEVITLARTSPMEAILRMALVGRHERITAERARQLGILSEVVPDAELEAARHESDRILADVQRQADGAAAAAAALARQRTQEVIEAARAEARGAVTVQRNVRGRLQDTRDHIDLALDRLVEEDTDLFATIDLTDAALAVAAEDDLGPDRGDDSEGPADVPPPGQGPPTPPVPPPSVRTTPESNLDLPYADDDDDDAGTIVVDLTDGRDGGGENGNGDVGGIPAAPADEPDPDDGGGDTADATPPVATTAAGEDEDDALSQMVKNAVENALRRRKGDPEPPPTDPT